VQPTQPISHLLRRLWHHISPQRRKQFGLLVVLMLLTSFSEVLSIGVVMPFLGVITAPERIFHLTAAQPLIQALKLTEPTQLLLPISVAFGVAVLIAGAMRLLLLWSNARLSLAAGADLSLSVYRRTLYQPYAVHCTRNSSEVINGITIKIGSAISAITNIINIVSSVVLITAILIALFFVDPVTALVAFGGFGLIYALIIRLTRNRLLTNSQISARESTNVIKSLQEGLGGIRDVLINGNQATYCQIYRNADLPLRRVQASNLFISGSPRFAMEALGMILIAVLAYSLALQADGITAAIPILGALALGSQRLLPVLQVTYGAWSGILGGQAP
jgi:ABC-type multidrug transport system fused ATPase/permease subunit